MNRMAFHRAIGQAAVDHNDLVPHVAQRPDATDAAPIELHAAADAVRPAAQHDDAGLLRDAMVVSWGDTLIHGQIFVAKMRFQFGIGLPAISAITPNTPFNV